MAKAPDITVDVVADMNGLIGTFREIGEWFTALGNDKTDLDGPEEGGKPKLDEEDAGHHGVAGAPARLLLSDEVRSLWRRQISGENKLYASDAVILLDEIDRLHAHLEHERHWKNIEARKRKNAERENGTLVAIRDSLHNPTITTPQTLDLLIGELQRIRSRLGTQ